MATLFNTKIKDTYQSLLKLEDNTILTTTTKNVTDGLGNASPLYMSTTRVGIGTNNPTGVLHVVSAEVQGGNNGGQIVLSQSGANSAVVGIQGSGWNTFGIWGISRFTTTSVPDLRIFADGKVSASVSLLVGSITASTAKLTVRGDGSSSATTSLLVQNSSGTQLFSITDDGAILQSVGSANFYNGLTVQFAGIQLNNNGSLTTGGNVLATGSLSRIGNFNILTTGNASTGFGVSTEESSVNFQGDALGQTTIGSQFTFRKWNSTTATLNNINSGIIRITKTGFNSGNANNLSGNTLWIEPIYNFSNASITGTTVRGIYYNPTLTSLTNTTHIALETVTGNVLLGTTSGNVGIGTSSPTNPLDIAYSPGRLISFKARTGYVDYGQIVFSSVTTAEIISSGAIGLGPSDTNKSLYLGNGLTSKITTPGSTKYDGFGNQTPSTLAGSGNQPVLFTSSIGDSNIDGFIFENTSTGSRNLFKLIQNNTTLLTVNPNGNTLIGTTTDSGYKLDVNGTLRSGIINFTANNGKIQYATDIYMQFPAQGGPVAGVFADGGYGWNFNSTQTYSTLRPGNGTTTPSTWTLSQSTKSFGRNTFHITTDLTNASGGSSVGETITLLNVNGNSPTAPYAYRPSLKVRAGNSGTHSGADQYAGSGHLYLESGDANSGTATDVAGGTIFLNSGRGTGTGTPGNIIFSTSTATTTGTTLQTLSERMRITGTGNVGVGEASPTARLQVKGSGSTSATTSLLVQNSAGTLALQ
jgi:hypothetical protein